MRGLSRIVLFFTLLDLVGFSHAQSTPTIQGQGPYSITITRQDKTSTIGAPHVVRITLTNISKDDILLAILSGSAEPFFEIEAHDSQGNPIRRIDKSAVMSSSELPVGSYRPKILHPGESIQKEVDLGKMFDLTRGGTFRIRAHRRDDPTGIDIQSNFAHLTVTK
jgi:hypothetical protein